MANFTKNKWPGANIFRSAIFFHANFLMPPSVFRKKIIAAGALFLFLVKLATEQCSRPATCIAIQFTPTSFNTRSFPGESSLPLPTPAHHITHPRTYTNTHTHSVLADRTRSIRSPNTIGSRWEQIARQTQTSWKFSQKQRLWKRPAIVGWSFLEASSVTHSGMGLAGMARLTSSPPVLE